MAKKTLTFSFIWNRFNPNFHENAEYQNLFFRAQENYSNDRLKAGRFITVNDIADAMGFERSTKGMVYGWVNGEHIKFIIRRDEFLGTVILDLVASEIHNSTDRFDRAKELIHNALLLRMNGDISHMPMTQDEWDSKADAFLCELDEEN